MNIEAAHAVGASEPPDDATSRLLAVYGAPVPRYTSYPTAVQFSDAVGAGTYREWLALLGPEAGPLSIYLHIPFCDRMCWYCGCHTAVVNTRKPVEDYVARLVAEIDLVADVIPQRLAIGSIHFGGGTPNMLAPRDLAAIIGRLRARFDMTGEVDIAAEIDPRILSPEWVAAAAAAGMNRASLGVQDFAPDAQAAINRAQPYDLVAKAVAMLRAAGIGSINLDLMYGLPRQTLAGLDDTITQALALSPDRLSLFGYAHVPWLKSHQKLINESELPDARLRHAMQRRAAEALEDAGWTRLGLDHFAKPEDSLAGAAAAGRMKRNFQGYTTDEASVLLGFGASSIGRLPQGYAQNVAAVPGWRDRVARGELPVVRGVPLDDDDRFRAEIIERLMCDFRADLADICARHDRPIADLADERAALREMALDGLVELNGSMVDVTRTGRDFVRSVCSVFDRHLDRTARRHSSAV